MIWTNRPPRSWSPQAAAVTALALASVLTLLGGAGAAHAQAQGAGGSMGASGASGPAGAGGAVDGRVDTRLGAPMGTPLGSAAVEPLQRSVEASRQPVNTGLDAAAPAASSAAEAGMALRMDRGGATAGAEGAAAPMNSAATVGADYRIGPSDLLDFDVYGVPDMQRTVRVNASGVVSLPLIGPVALAGMTTAQAEALIAQKYAQDFLQNPQVSLFIKEFTSQRITIEGAVARPGIYPVTGQLTLLRALALAGGGGQYAMLNEVMLFRSGSALEANTQMFDLEKIRSGEIADPIINADDVIVVKRDPKRTALRDSFFGDVLSTLNPFK
jgi:polysaccharide biosynthesis/export protein